jgi:hypothetical protein
MLILLAALWPLGLIQPLTEICIRYLPGGKTRLQQKAYDLIAICEAIVYVVCDPRCVTTLWTSTACFRDSSTFSVFLYLFVTASVV